MNYYFIGGNSNKPCCNYKMIYLNFTAKSSISYQLPFGQYFASTGHVNSKINNLNFLFIFMIIKAMKVKILYISK